jgi:hypothetical protein
MVLCDVLDSDTDLLDESFVWRRLRSFGFGRALPVHVEYEKAVLE